MSILGKSLHVTMPDGSVWSVPVIVIAKHRATSYASEYGNEISRSLSEDTIPLFEDDEYEIKDWAANNMNWSDVMERATVVTPASVDYQEGWVNGDKKVVLG